MRASTRVTTSIQSFSPPNLGKTGASASSTTSASSSGSRVIWPPLPYQDWRPTKETLHRYVQIVGKVRMSLVPFRNHWWHVTLYVSTRGVTTGPMPYGDLSVEIELDLVEHRVWVLASDGR